MKAVSSRAILALAAVVAVALLAPHGDFVPLWDGLAYAECAVDVVTNRFALYFLRCYGHPAYVYSGILAVVQLLDVGNPALLLLVNALVLAAATVGFHRLMRRAFPGEGYETEIALLTAAFLLQPPFLASVLQPALDLPVLAGTVWCTVLLIERRWFWCAAVGTAMAFSKETGFLLYTVLLGCCVLWLLARTPGTLAARLRALLPLAPTIAPMVLYAGYVLAFRIVRPGQAAVWEVGDGRSPILELLTPRLDAEVASYLALLFVLNFAWIPSVWIASDAAAGVVRRVRGRKARPLAGVDGAAIGFLTLAAVATLIALTRFITFSNVRYLMAGIGLVLGVAYVALVRLGLRPGVRRVALGAYVVLLVASALRTVDPVSRRLWGTFQFGSHPMLDMTSISGECCGRGRDQLVYSLEFTRFHELTDMVLTTLMRDTATVIALPTYGGYLFIERLDRATWRRTLRRRDAFEPFTVSGPFVPSGAEPPQSMIYIAMPNAKDPVTLPLLANGYVVGPEQRFESDGYAVSVYRLERKQRNSSDVAAALVTPGDRVDLPAPTTSVPTPPRTARGGAATGRPRQ
jgi:hypothetical protein